LQNYNIWFDIWLTVALGGSGNEQASSKSTASLIDLSLYESLNK